VNDQNKSDESIINNFRAFVANLNSSLQVLHDKYKDLFTKLNKNYENFDAHCASVKRLEDDKDKEIMDLIQQSRSDLENIDVVSVSSELCTTGLAHLEAYPSGTDELKTAELKTWDTSGHATAITAELKSGEIKVGPPSAYYIEIPGARIVEEPVEISMPDLDGTTKKLVDGKWVPFEFKEPALIAEPSASVDDEPVVPPYGEDALCFRRYTAWQCCCTDYFNDLREKIQYLGNTYDEEVGCYINDPFTTIDKEWENLKSLIAKARRDVTILHKEITMRDPDNTKIATTDEGVRLIKDNFGEGFTC
jgi:hypothetical protein